MTSVVIVIVTCHCLVMPNPVIRYPSPKGLSFFMKILPSLKVFYYIPLTVLATSSFLLGSLVFSIITSVQISFQWRFSDLFWKPTEIARKLVGTSTASRSGHQWRRNQRAVTQLALVVVSYLIGYLPLIVYFLNTKHDPSNAANQRTDYWVRSLKSTFSWYFRALAT